METPFAVCLSASEWSATPELTRAAINLHPGSGVSHQHTSRLVLAAGFPALTPNTEVPLSSTFFLNSGLAKLSDAQLLSVAKAELQRISSVNFRSYTAEPDNRVAVLSDDAEKLLAFLDNYGGVLEIEPLLMKGSHPELLTVAELSFSPVSGGKKGCRLEYLVRSPIDLARCTYCGNCGAVCPEQCIDEQLFLDYTRCSLCRKCEPVCPAEAVDVYGVESRSLEVPAVILLGGVKVEDDAAGGPSHKGGRNFFRETELDEYFATLFPLRIDELVTLDRNLCQYSAKHRQSCNYCLSGCSVGAITQNEDGVQVDSLKCTECGACFGACPTGALQYEKFTDRRFLEYLNTFAAPQEYSGKTVVIGDDAGFQQLWWLGRQRDYQDTLFLGFDQPQGLSLFHYLALAVRGVGSVVVLGPAATGFAARQQSMANLLLAGLCGKEGFVRTHSPKSFAAEPMPVLRASNALQGGLQEGTPFTFEGGSNRREIVAAYLQLLARRGGRSLAIDPARDLSQSRVPFATVRCDADKCTQCAACLNDCRIGALSVNSEAMQLNLTAALCVGCTSCVQSCPENALSISPQFTINDDFFVPVELARAEPMACKRCGKVFGTRKSYERVMAILAAREQVNTSHFEYCENCRVINLFEEQEQHHG